MWKCIGRVYEITDGGGQRTSRVVVDKLTQPAGVAFKDGSLYVMAIDKVLRFDGIEKNPNAAPVDMTAAFKLPPGFKAEVWATGIPGTGRAMARGEKGKIYVGTRAIGRIYEVTDQGDKRTAPVVVGTLTQPAGVAFQDGALYVMAIDKVLRFDGIEDNPNAQSVDLTKAFNLPPLQHHNWKYITFGPGTKPQKKRSRD